MIDGKALILWAIFLSLTLQSLASLYLLNQTLLKIDKLQSLEQALEKEKESLSSFLAYMRNDLTLIHDHWKIVNSKIDDLANNNIIIPNEQKELKTVDGSIP